MLTSLQGASTKPSPCCAFALALVLTTGLSAAPQDYPVRPVPVNQVHLCDQFWRPRIETNAGVTVPACLAKCEETRIPNFRRAPKLQDGPYQGDPFDDSDVFKVAEGAAYALAANSDPARRRALDDLVELFGKAQQPDGYLYTACIIHGDKAPGRAGPVRWLNDMGGVTGDDSHELYNAGHLIEAAVAHYRSTQSRAFLDIAIRLADLIDKTWGPRQDQLKIPPGHQEIELALVKLGRATSQRKYIALAKFLLDCRGHYRRPAGVKAVFPDTAELKTEFVPGLLGGVTVLRGTGQAMVRRAGGPPAAAAAELQAIPYHAWCNRGAGQMQVWMPRTLDPEPHHSK